MLVYTRHNNKDGTMSIYREGKFIGCVENNTASCDVFHSMNNYIVKLQEENKLLTKSAEFCVMYHNIQEARDTLNAVKLLQRNEQC